MIFPRYLCKLSDGRCRPAAKKMEKGAGRESYKTLKKVVPKTEEERQKENGFGMQAFDKALLLLPYRNVRQGQRM